MLVTLHSPTWCHNSEDHRPNFYYFEIQISYLLVLMLTVEVSKMLFLLTSSFCLMFVIYCDNVCNLIVSDCVDAHFDVIYLMELYIIVFYFRIASKILGFPVWQLAEGSG